ncbi:DUF4185 domain-containing protein [Paenibacillus antri]|uniref:DUF4185 domain-containing protein n=1 Tax=Paenibacillus antri TaxID=2582848 RepID=A0A5R9G157_9BACL|nr:DUF4185 domain-containing protein [Paenibacillus antri]TLS49521.1 DUF4185 domain-containing protein [Paenibacillus antri]
MKLRRAWACALAFGVAAGTAAACGTGERGTTEKMLEPDGSAFVLESVAGLEQVALLTGADGMNRTDGYAVYGTDLGSMFNVGDTTYFVFGDTFGERPPDMTGGGGSFWRSNAMAYSTDADPSDGIAFDGMIVDDIGLAKELLPSVKRDFEEITKIPTHGLYANDTMYLYYMSVNHWGEPGHWDANYAGVAKSADEGQTWTVLDDVKWPGDSGFIQVSPYRIQEGDGEADIYFWGVPSGRFGGVKLMKAKESRIESLDGYAYFAGTDDDGKPIWSSEPKEAATVVDDTVGELSVVWNPYLERWLMTYLREGQGVVIREGAAPWGPWGEPIVLVDKDEYPGLYGPYMNPRYTENDGKTIYFALSLWDPYNVFWFKADLEKKS